MNVMAPSGRPPGRLRAERVTLAHGGGGKAMRDLIKDVFVAAFRNPEMGEMEDQARLTSAALAEPGARLAFTTDSFVVDPLVFPGGDIGKIAVCGTVNDLAVGGARPLWLSAAFIIEEGVEVALLRRIADSMRAAAEEAGVAVVTGDTKVVGRGAADKLFVTTSGVGAIPAGVAMDQIERASDMYRAAAETGQYEPYLDGYGFYKAGEAIFARAESEIETESPDAALAIRHALQFLASAYPDAGVQVALDADQAALAAAASALAAAHV